MLSQDSAEPTLHRQHRAKSPRFCFGIHVEMFQAAAQFFNQFAPGDPLTLSVDDTKLCPKIRTYPDPQGRGTYVVGQVGEPILVPHDHELAPVLKDAGVHKGTKVC